MMRREMIQRRALRLETLEDRWMLAGNVTAELVGDDLIVTGNRFSNQIEVADNGNGVDVIGLNDTKINGVPNGVKSFDQITGNLRIRMNAGEDTVVVSDVGSGAYDESSGADNEVLGRIVISGGPGRNIVLVYSPNDSFPRINGLSILGGDAADCAYVYGVDIEDSAATTDLFVRLGGGDDTLVMDSDEDIESFVAGNTQIDVGAGNDQVKISKHFFTTPGASLRAILGAGNDLLAAIDSSFNGDVRVFGGRGRDVIGTFGSTFAGDVYIQGGAGRDQLIAENSIFGESEDDSVSILGGRGNDWFAVIGGNEVNSSGRVLGGPGFDNGYEDGSNTVNGPWQFVVEGLNPHPNLADLIDQLLGIDCIIPDSP